MGSESLGITSPPLQGASPAQHTQPSFSVSLTLPSGTSQGHKLCPHWKLRLGAELDVACLSSVPYIPRSHV